MTEDILQDASQRMEATINAARQDFAGIRTGRANPALLDRIQVEYYGAVTPIQQVATISVPEPRLLVIQPWDKSSIKDIEKAILQSDLGLTPSNDGSVIRIQLPQLTEERRKDLVRVVRKAAEEHRVAVRNIRREVNDDIKELEKSGDLSEDEARRAQAKAQEVTDKSIAQIDQMLQVKESEIMEV